MAITWIIDRHHSGEVPERDEDGKDSTFPKYYFGFLSDVFFGPITMRLVNYIAHLIEDKT